jgi:hypothetical protein
MDAYSFRPSLPVCQLLVRRSAELENDAAAAAANGAANQANEERVM